MAVHTKRVIRVLGNGVFGNNGGKIWYQHEDEDEDMWLSRD